MARAIDAEKFMELLKEQYLHNKSMGNSQAARAWQGAIQLLYDMPTLTPPNEPLTLDELREMDGEPVYVVFRPDISGEKPQFWVLVSVDEWNDIYLANKEGWAFNYEKFLGDVEGIYRRPPERQEDAK